VTRDKVMGAGVEKENAARDRAKGRDIIAGIEGGRTYVRA